MYVFLYFPENEVLTFRTWYLYNILSKHQKHFNIQLKSLFYFFVCLTFRSQKYFKKYKVPWGSLILYTTYTTSKKMNSKKEENTK